MKNNELTHILPAVDESHEKLKVVLESVYNAIIAVDSQGFITTWNPSAERITGVAAENAVGKYVTDVIPNTGLLETLRTGEGCHSRKIQFGDITAITNRSLIMNNGQITGAVAVLQDISDLEAIASELKASQELNKELEAIIDSVYEGLYITDGQGYTTRINKSYTRITGIRPEEVIGWHMQDLVEKGYYSQSVTLIVLEKKQPVTIMHTIKGSKRCLITGNPVFNEKGRDYPGRNDRARYNGLDQPKAKLEQSEEMTRDTI